MPSLDLEEWPPDLHRPEVVGVFVGGCILRGDGSSFRAKAHAHCKGERKGWLCFRKRQRLEERALVLHELAHLLTEEGHTDRWRAKLLEIGGTLDPVPGLLKSYIKRPRLRGGR